MSTIIIQLFVGINVCLFFSSFSFTVHCYRLLEMKIISFYLTIVVYFSYRRKYQIYNYLHLKITLIRPKCLICFKVVSYLFIYFSFYFLKLNLFLLQFFYFTFFTQKNRYAKHFAKIKRILCFSIWLCYCLYYLINCF